MRIDDILTISGKRVLVTGADGFIGSHLTEELVRQGANVRALTIYNSLGTKGWLDHAARDIREAIDYRPGDIRDPFFVNTITKDIDVVFHLAALIAIPYSYVAPQAYLETNVGGTANVVEAARSNSVERCIVTSTSEVYGTARAVPITEDHPLQAQSPYSASKIGADMIALSYHKSFDTPVSVVRPFNTYGPRQSARAVLPTIITQIAAGITSIKLGDTRPTRDFNYVKDTVSGFIALAKSAKSIGHVTNLASNYEISVGEAVKLIAHKMGVEITIEIDAARLRPEASEVERLWGDNGLALTRAGWRPIYGGLDGFERGLEETIAWFRDPANLALYNPGRYEV
ncbi:NAD-dependent 4,6-dehydratase LegB [Mesorhizobium shangrilense]|uniref:NAD-dependent 4,6-dehydratase LegB n=1 Tax=Mesorhizobium shangrilense TaxID=460060 RepID=A0ABV2DQ68_9HYPH